MALNQMLSVLDEYDKFLQNFTHPIIEWKTGQRRLIYHKNLKSTFHWRFNVFLGFGLHGLAGIFLLLLVLHGSVKLSPLPVLMVHIILLFLWCYNFFVGVAMVLHGEQFVDGWNLLLWEFRKLEVNVPKTTTKSKSPRPAEPIDLFWLAMSGMIYQFTFIPFILVLAAFILRLDPLIHLLEMAKLTPLLHTLSYLSIFYVIVTTHFEGCRLYPLPIIVAFSLFKMLTCLILSLTRARNQWRLHNMVTKYVRLFIILEKMRRLQEFFIAAFMLIAMCATVLFTFVTIRMYTNFPLWFYSFFPSVNVFIVIFVLIGLGVGIEVRTRSEEVLRMWEVWMWGICAGRERQIMRRRLDALRVMEFGGRIHYGRLYRLDRGIQLKYFEKVVIYTINLLLGVPRF
ncbi:hypothetical protein Fcan01_17956 [Folsomia candida]|uniref:Odorant receptor n=1 Tax=Folsomia candida TaxID=158441 RepID=A0A226DS56_FOLCA|nr:hypothetical protein Fcan01_17956 [Folsomia candida]